ncbi:hypothetical protein [Dysgonomonas sp. ZJ279]|uniref:hypothetical protein n=1 Tax=Dysgonomonas sp. ZJ279 TaxID=2709796 RepID=UPI0013EAC033|nr:hypothetical protein [Dysgonomonas sp. ZJ279]
MKKLFLLLLLLFSMTMAFAQAPRRLLTEFTYDAANQKPLIFSRTLDLNGSTIDFNLPFAYHFEIRGSHVEFSINYDDVMWYFFRKGDKTYFDLEVSLHSKNHICPPGRHSCVPTSLTVGIIRIIYME